MLSWILAILKTTPERWISLATDLPPDLLTVRPPAGRWSAIECLQHTFDIEQVFQSRIAQILEGKAFPNFDPDQEEMKPRPTVPPITLAQQFSSLRDTSISIISGLANEDFNKTAIHEDLGQVSIEQLLYEWAGHDLIHLRQAELVLMQPFVKNCGPWQKYYGKYIIP